MKANPGLVRQAVLKPLAARRDLDYDTELVAPGSSEAAQAYGFVSCGGELLVALVCFGHGFPSADRRTTKRGVKWLREQTLTEGVQTASVYLAQAIALNFEMLMKRSGDEFSEKLHRSFRDLIQRVYPLDKDTLVRQEELTAEYRVMESHEVPHEVKVGVRMGTGYHMALLRDDFSEYENVDEDERLVEIQERYAAGFLRSIAMLDAIELVIGHEKFEQLEPKLLTPSDMSIERLAQQNADAALWGSGAKSWHEQGERVIAAEPEPEPLRDEVAEFLRRRTSTMLFQPKGKLTEAAMKAIHDYAASVSEREVDWNLLTDAEMIGYWLRRSEEELDDHHVITGELRTALVTRARSDPNDALMTVALKLTADQYSPKLFSRNHDSWQELRAWGQAMAANHSTERRRRGMEADETPQVTAESAGIGFDFGYALRAAESAVHGEDE